VFASRFLMKRRNKEFALYMMLGMGKRKISAILIMESLIVGAGSLFVGLLVGVAASQLMSALVAGLFEADMAAYKLSVSIDALVLTIICFAIMYLAVMLLNGVIMTRMKLIDLMQSGKKSEKVSMKNPYVCIGVFLVSCVALGWSYYQVAYSFSSLSRVKLMTSIVLGAVTTFLIFWSISGLMLRIVMSLKKTYFKSLNAFTFRQISSKINTMVFSMTIICLMLFVTICTLAAAFSVRNAMNKNLKELCPADVQIGITYLEGTDENGEETKLELLYKECGEDIKKNIKEYNRLKVYSDESFTMRDFLSSAAAEFEKENEFIWIDGVESVVKLSEYNGLRTLYGQKPLELDEDEYILVCNYVNFKSIRDYVLSLGESITVFGHTLKPKYDKTIDGFIEIGSQAMNGGIFVIPDEVVDESKVHTEYFTGNYNETEKEVRARIDEEAYEAYEHVMAYAGDTEASEYFMITTKSEIFDAAVGIGAILTFLGLYIGIVFLIASGAILALKELSESVDSISRYEMLRKIGADESAINRSLLRQTGIFFLLPLILAAIHSFFGMKFAVRVLEVVGTEGIAGSILSTSIILAIIYGGYFAVTYFNSKSIINTKAS
ncbi:MAG: ABC transporter permease, partial [Lachnospiraceae bacterium]|nr:ABC transporter permease [Lachnospiraceae bacterium]